MKTCFCNNTTSLTVLLTWLMRSACVWTTDQPHVPLCQNTGSGHGRRLAAVWAGTFLHHRWLHPAQDQGDQGHWQSAIWVSSFLIFCANICRIHCRKWLHTEILYHIPHKPKTEWDLECSFICWFVFYWGSKFKRKSNNNVSSNSKKNGNVDSTLKGLTSMHLLLWILL